MRRLPMALLSRRRFLVGAGALSAISPKSSPAQQAKAPTVGWLASGHTANTLPAAFRAALRDLGYIEGRSIRIEARWAEGNSEKLRELARDLVRQPVDVIVSNGRGATRAAQEATAAIPVVMAPVDDPYEFVASLSRPSGNITGLALQQTEIDAKQIEMLKEIAPQLSRLAILYYYGETYYALESIAHALGIEVLWIAIKGASDVENAFAEAQVKKANGLLIVDTGALGVTCEMIAKMAFARRMPAAGSWRSQANAGLLLTYAADDSHLQHRAASYVDRLLKGAKPADLPVEQVTKFELVLNLRTAKELGISVPAAMLLRAHEVID